MTGINQSKIDNLGIDIKTGIKMFLDFAKGSHVLSWGNDIDVIIGNCDLFEIDLSLDNIKFSDIRKLFEKYSIKTNLYSSGTIHSFNDIHSPLKPGKEHNALSDCISIVSALYKLENIFGEDNLLESIENIY